MFLCGAGFQMVILGTFLPKKKHFRAKFVNLSSSIPDTLNSL